MPDLQRDAKKLPAELREGSVFDGKYRVECVLGMGGMGVVLLAHDQTLAREVALKVLLPDRLGDEEIVQRFLGEGRAVALLTGEHVCRVLDVSQSSSGMPYMVLEWLVGRNLDEICREEGPLEPRLAVDYVLQACHAVAQAHARGIVHRDIKPSNLFLTHGPDGEVVIKVLDFGIAKMNDLTTKDGEPLTETGVMLGSPQFMAPEQMKSSRQVDSRADIWSFGAVLFRLTVGRAPFLAPSLPELFASVLHDPPPLASALAPEVPPGLDAAIRRCLEKDRERRFQTLDELATAIAPFASDAAVGARSAGRIKAIRERGAWHEDDPTSVDAATDDVTTAEPSRPVFRSEDADVEPELRAPVPPPPVSAPRVAPPRPSFAIVVGSGAHFAVQEEEPLAASRVAVAGIALATVALVVGLGVAVRSFTSHPAKLEPQTTLESARGETTHASTASTPETSNSAAPTEPQPEATLQADVPETTASASATAPISSFVPSPAMAKPPTLPRRPPPKKTTTTSDRHG